MTQISVSQFLTVTTQDKNLNEKLKTATTIQGCIEIAESYGYKFSSKNLAQRSTNCPMKL